jgi:lipopolysaccharide transport system permease protein
MNNAHSTSPAAILSSVIQHRGLVWDLVKRDFIGRYKGSIMGVAWSLFNPLLIPIVLLPLILLTLGLSWLFASLGVYLRDLSQSMGIVTTVLLFLAPVFYPIEALPGTYRALIAWNPITLPITQLRDLMLWDKPLDWGQWAVSLVIGAAVSYIGYWWFQKSRRGFADVL